LLPYFLAIRDDDAHNAIPIWELTPVFLTFFAWLLFDDVLTGMQLLGAAVVIAGGFLFSWDFGKSRIRLRTFLLMSLSAFCFAIYQLALRFGALNETIWNTMLIIWIGNFVCAVVLFAVLPLQRKLFIESVRTSGGRILMIAFGEEILATGGNVSLVAAFALAPKAGQVGALSATQSIFVLLISAVLGFLLPQYYTRVVWGREIKIKCLLLCVIAGGVVLLKSS
jgi:drug/metabolite transporter (DMT)-like permease